MIDFVGMVREFHERMNVPINKEPVSLPLKEWELRHALLKEEYQEYKDSKSLIELVDAYGDMIYVIIGSCIAQGIDIEAVFTEIHRSNMTKLPENNLPGVAKIKKGPEFEPPELAKVLGIDDMPIVKGKQ